MVDFMVAKAKLAGISVVGLVIIALAVALVMSQCRSPEKPKIPPQDQAALDKQASTLPAFNKTQDSGNVIIKHDTIFAKATNASANQSKANAAKLEAAADSIARLAVLATTAADSARKYHQAFDERGLAIDSLHTAIVKKDSAIQYWHDAFTGKQFLYTADSARRVAAEDLTGRLKKDIDKLQQPCKVIGPIPCPSRIVASTLSGIAGVLAGHAIK
jgi:hypothetical protein